MAEPTTAIPTGGDSADLVELTDIKSGGELPATSPESSDALDILLKQAAAPAPESDETPAPAPDGKKKDETPAPAPDGKKKDETPAPAPDGKKKDETPAPAPDGKKKDETPAPAPDGKKKDETPAPAPKADVYDAVQLPPNTSRKAGDAFSEVKTLARQRDAEALKTITDLNARVSELEAKTKSGLPPEGASELEELRTFRAKLDVEADPTFKQWDTKVSENVESIYSKLSGAGVGAEVIAKIKEMGGPAEVDWESLSSKLPPQVKRYIEGKLFENEDLADRKKKAVESAKANVNEYIKTRQTEVEKAGENRKQVVEAQLKELSPKMEWLKEQIPTDKSTPEEKKSIEAHNNLLKEIRTSMTDALHDDSPEMKAILILGFAQLQKARADFDSFRLTAAAEKKTLESKLSEAEGLLERIKKSSTGRLRESSAPSPDAKDLAKPVVNPNEDAGSALDRHLAEARAKSE